MSDNFSPFCSNLRMTDTVVSNVRYRYKKITKRLNWDFRDLDSDTRHSLYVGSFGRGSAIHVSEIGMVIELPYSVYQQYDDWMTRDFFKYLKNQDEEKIIA
jgi:hypothetical protein